MGGDTFPGAAFRPTLQPKPEKRDHHVNLSYISDHIISDHIISYIQSCQPLISNLQKRAKGDKLVKTETEPGNSIILSTFPIYRNCTRWQAVKLKKSSQNLFARATGGKLKAGLSLFIDKDDFQRSNMICKTSQECETALMSQFRRL